MKAKNRNSYLLRTFGITEADYDRMLTEQGGKCAICRSTDTGHRDSPFHVDHCHTTGAVRGLLCIRCNTGIGQLQDSPQLLQAAVSYLEAANRKKVA